MEILRGRVRYAVFTFGAVVLASVTGLCADEATVKKALQLVELSIQCPTPAVSYKEVDWEPPVSKLITRQFLGDDDMFRVAGKTDLTFDSSPQDEVDGKIVSQFTTNTNRFRYDVPLSALAEPVASDNKVTLTCADGGQCVSHNQYFHCSDCTGNDDEDDVANRLQKFDLTMCDAATAQRLAVGLKILVDNRRPAGGG